jgi:hypothetical protein
LLFLFCPETAYRRANHLNIDLGSEKILPELADSKTANTTHSDANETANEQPWTFWEYLRPWRGIETDDNVIRAIIRPLPLLLFPQVFYAFLTYGLSWSWVSVVVRVYALIFGGSPYNMSVSAIGLSFGLGALIASFLGFIAGPINDSICKIMARRNEGTYEPEVSFT